MFKDFLVTVWSAPNYCYRQKKIKKFCLKSIYRCGNIAAILELDENLQKYYKIFEAAPSDVRTGNNKSNKSVPDYFL
jgi:serine/threonine-protein phosphatase 4 catalytic subunit